MILTLALTAGLCQTAAPSQAATPKLSTKKLTIKVGKTAALKVKKTSKKAKWSIVSGKKNIRLTAKKKTSVKVKAVKAGNIIIPEEFEVGFDHVTNLIAGLGMEDDPNYYLTRGYPGSVNTYVFNSISEPANNSYPPTNEETFIGYMHLSIYYNQARRAEVYPADKYPFLTEKFAFVQKYLKDKYQIDLEAIANGPEDWDLPLPPIPETPDEE